MGRMCVSASLVLAISQPGKVKSLKLWASLLNTSRINPPFPNAWRPRSCSIPRIHPLEIWQPQQHTKPLCHKGQCHGSPIHASVNCLLHKISTKKYPLLERSSLFFFLCPIATHKSQAYVTMNSMSFCLPFQLFLCKKSRYIPNDDASRTPDPNILFQNFSRVEPVTKVCVCVCERERVLETLKKNSRVFVRSC